MNAPEPDFPFLFRPGQPVKFSGGKYNGFIGNIQWIGDTTCSVVVEFEHKFSEIVENVKFVSPYNPNPPQTGTPTI